MQLLGSQLGGDSLISLSASNRLTESSAAKQTPCNSGLEWICSVCGVPSDFSTDCCRICAARRPSDSIVPSELASDSQNEHKPASTEVSQTATQITSATQPAMPTMMVSPMNGFATQASMQGSGMMSMPPNHMPMFTANGMFMSSNSTASGPIPMYPGMQPLMGPAVYGIPVGNGMGFPLQWSSTNSSTDLPANNSGMFGSPGMNGGTLANISTSSADPSDKVVSEAMQHTTANMQLSSTQSSQVTTNQQFTQLTSQQAQSPYQPQPSPQPQPGQPQLFSAQSYPPQQYQPQPYLQQTYQQQGYQDQPQAYQTLPYQGQQFQSTTYAPQQLPYSQQPYAMPMQPAVVEGQQYSAYTAMGTNSGQLQQTYALKSPYGLYTPQQAMYYQMPGSSAPLATGIPQNGQAKSMTSVSSDSITVPAEETTAAGISTTGNGIRNGQVTRAAKKARVQSPIQVPPGPPSVYLLIDPVTNEPKTNEDLIRHMSSDSSGRFTCQDCKKSFKSRSDLISHARTHTGEKPLACGHCGKRFAHSSNLRSHERTHTGEKRYPCPYPGCARRFAHPSSRDDHYATHTGQRRHRCSECGKTFTAKANLTRHRRDIHKIPPKNPRPVLAGRSSSSNESTTAEAMLALVRSASNVDNDKPNGQLHSNGAHNHTISNIKRPRHEEDDEAYEESGL